MPSLEAIRSGLANTISNGVQDTLWVYSTIADVAEFPALMVWPAEADFTQTMSRGLDMWWFNVFVLCNKNDYSISQDQLDGFLTGDGPNSIRRILFERGDLNLPETEATVERMVGYGGTFQDAKIPLVGAILKVRVYTDGRA